MSISKFTSSIQCKQGLMLALMLCLVDSLIFACWVTTNFKPSALQIFNKSSASLTDVQEKVVGDAPPGKLGKNLRDHNWTAPYAVQASHLLPPRQVLKDYKEWHSHESLLRQPENRKFVIGYYSCPLQAGNRLHDFFNSLIAAIATNRTLLWKYYDKETCSKFGGSIDPAICKNANTEAACSGVLKRASWIPSFDEWAPMLNITTDDVGQRNGHLGGDRKKVRDQLKSRVFNVMQMVYQQNAFQFNFIASASDRDIVRKMYSETRDFLYGMLFRETFRLLPEWITPEFGIDASANTFSIGLHSRHEEDSMDGTDVAAETECLERVLSKRRTHEDRHSSCKVFIMSDRVATLELLAAYLKTKNCTAVIASHEESTSFHAEHGPFAGKSRIMIWKRR
jgi:hypothetical protein